MDVQKYEEQEGEKRSSWASRRGSWRGLQLPIGRGGFYPRFHHSRRSSLLLHNRLIAPLPLDRDRDSEFSLSRTSRASTSPCSPPTTRASEITVHFSPSSVESSPPHNRVSHNERFLPSHRVVLPPVKSHICASAILISKSRYPIRVEDHRRPHPSPSESSYRPRNSHLCVHLRGEADAPVPG